MCDILVDHNTVQNLAVLDLASRNLLDTCVTLDVNLLLASHLRRDCANSLERKTAHQLRPPRNKLCANRGVDDPVHLIVVVHIDVGRDLADDLEGIGQSLLEGLNDNDGMDVALELRQSLSKDFTSCCLSVMSTLSVPQRRTQNDDSCCAITDLLVLCPAELDHALCCRVCDFDFSEDSVAVVGENDTTHGIEQHLQHGLGTQT